ncbi:MAG: sulfate adenylyltransferase [Acidimicrobiia bacterium]
MPPDRDGLIAPHGGRLVDLLAGPDRRAELVAAARRWPVWNLTPRQLCDLELLVTGAFSPLGGFMGRADYESVCVSMRLADGTLWSMPITLDVSHRLARHLGPGATLGLRDPYGLLLAALHVDDVWRPDRCREAHDVYRTTSTHHPGVAHLLGHSHGWYVGGRIEGLRLPDQNTFADLRLRPDELRAEFARLGWDRIVAFHTRNPLHRAHYELTRRAAETAGAKLLLHPVVGMTKPGDLDAATRVRCYRAVMGRYPAGTARLAVIPMAMRMAGPRDALWNAIIRKNYGCTHYIVGRDHASPGHDRDGTPFYDPYEAQDLLRSAEEELGVRTVAFPTMVYLPAADRYLPEAEVPAGAATRTVSGTLLRQMLAEDAPLPEWVTFPEVAAELRR